MSDVERWRAVDDYTEGLLIGGDPVLERALDASAAAGLAAIAVTPSQGLLLNLLARMARATGILEIGSLGGYSAIWLARALPPDGRLVALELDPECARVTAENLARAGFGDRAEVRAGRRSSRLRRWRAKARGRSRWSSSTPTSAARPTTSRRCCR
jgi:predicted O-methyltransferase YrrM